MATSGMLCNDAHWIKGCLNHAEEMYNHASVADIIQDTADILLQKEEQAKKSTMYLTCCERDDKIT